MSVEASSGEATPTGLASPAQPVNETDAAIAKSYLAWKKNCPYLYESLATFELTWPSFTVQWGLELRTLTNPVNKQSQALLLGTSTTGQAEEYLRIGWVTLPETPTFSSLAKYDAETGLVGGYTPQTSCELKITQRIDQFGAVNRARYNPLHPNLVASFTATGAVGIYDLTKFPNNPCGIAQPNIALVGHKAEGIALEWSPQQRGWLASGDNDGNLFVWNIEEMSEEGKLEPKAKLSHDGSAVNDVSWHPHEEGLLASVGDDNMLRLNDLRTSDKTWKSSNLGRIASALAWNPVNDYLMGIGFDLGDTELWDLRNGNIPLAKFDSPHTDAVTSLSWSPHQTHILATASLDSSVVLWDATSSSGSSKLFKHAGHTAPVTDVSWNAAIPGMLASVATNNSLHIYRPGRDILGF